MDATVDDFLCEINKIVPPKQKKQSCDWQECFDEQTGYKYYWHLKTNEVTWEMPEQYKLWKESADFKQKQTSSALAPKPSSIGLKFKNTPTFDSKKIVKADNNDLKYAKKRSRKNSSDSEPEKIVLISSYGGDTESEDEENSPKKDVQIKSATIIKSSEIALTEELPEVKSVGKEVLVGNKSTLEPEKLLVNQLQQQPQISGISLLATYDDSDNEQEEEESNIPPASALFPIIPPSSTEDCKVSHSTLFPITTPIDVKQFEPPKPVEKRSEVVQSEILETKAFQRKRKINLEIVNVPRPTKVKTDNENSCEPERVGFGFKNVGSEYPGFKSGGIMFVKTDVLNPPTNEENNDSKSKDNTNEELLGEIEANQTTLSEKLRFLSEGREPASAVQIMLIQLETLYTALRAGCLTASYLHKWLKETGDELVKLEKEATPAGWVLQWDREQKRYYYYNKESGQSQWTYPELESVNGDDDAMDISTTPPPPDDNSQPFDEIVPPPPPIISEDMVPPPPPIISGPDPNELYPSHGITENQPLPPGVELPEIKLAKNEEKPTNGNDSLTSVLDSFYSDIAAIESLSTPIESHSPQSDPNIVEDVIVQPTKKKKKVKIVQGLSMKKKGVSKLVEKWKNVQKNLD